jgi:hypothetical protein
MMQEFAATVLSLTSRADAAERRAESERSRADLLQADLDRALVAARAAEHRAETAETALAEQQPRRWLSWLLTSSIERRSARRKRWRDDLANLNRAHDAVRAAEDRADKAETALAEQQRGRKGGRSS